MTTVDNYVERIIDERKRAHTEQMAIVTKAAEDNRTLTADEQVTVGNIDRALDGFDSELKSWKDRAERDRIADEARADVERTVRPVDKGEAGQPGDADMFRSFLRGESGKSFDIDLRPAAQGRAVWRTMNPGTIRRDLLEGTAAAGGTTVPTTFSSQLYDYLEVYSGVRRTGATILTTSAGEAMQFPRVATHGTAAIVGEGTALAEADPTFGAMILNAFKYGQLLQVSNELLADTGVDMLGFIARDTARALGRATDIHYVTGSGSNQPMGIMTAAATGATASNGGTGVPTYANLLDLVYSINSEYRSMSAAWLTRDANVAGLRKLLDGNGIPLWQPSLQVGVPDRLLGYPVVDDPNVAAFATGATATASSVKGLAFGDFSAFYIRDVQGIRFERSDEFAFSTDLVTFRAILRTDSDLIDTSAIKLLIGGTA
jgi:HK97 family phage major capsid protein